MNTRLALFCVVALAQIMAPYWMIVTRERILRDGRVFKFKTAPVDPYDAFRGRHVTLGFEAAQFKPSAGEEYERRQTVYGVLAEDVDGFAHFARLDRTPPSDAPYLRVRVQWQGKDDVRLGLPFDRYYLSEELAPEAERAYRSANAGREERKPVHAWAAVRVKDGNAVLEELYVDGRPIKDYLLRP